VQSEHEENAVCLRLSLKTCVCCRHKNCS